RARVSESGSRSEVTASRPLPELARPVTRAPAAQVEQVEQVAAPAPSMPSPAPPPPPAAPGPAPEPAPPTPAASVLAELAHLEQRSDPADPITPAASLLQGIGHLVGLVPAEPAPAADANFSKALEDSKRSGAAPVELAPASWPSFPPKVAIE